MVRDRLVLLGFALLLVGGLWLIALLAMPIYTEPGDAGSIRCGRSWRSDQVEVFLEDSCHDAVVSRRAALVFPASLIVVGLAVVLVRKQRGDDRAVQSSAA